MGLTQKGRGFLRLLSDDEIRKIHYGTLNILEGVRKLKDDCEIMVAGSSEEYGLVKPDECPITEENILNPFF